MADFMESGVEELREHDSSNTTSGGRACRPRVLFVTPEMGGYLKAGGLGEVAAALPRAMRLIADVRVLLPGYPAVLASPTGVDIIRQMPATAGLPGWTLGRTRTSDGLIIYVVMCDELYRREGSPYAGVNGRDFGDNEIRFARLSLAAAEIAAGEADPNWRPTILHANDWPSALAPAYARWKNLDTPSILTIHNLAYQGIYEARHGQRLGLPDSAYGLDGMEFHGQISFLKAGISYASHVTTVSETYAREITTPTHGCGLDGLLRRRLDAGELTGIINGIDDSWSNPEIDNNPLAMQRWKAHHAEEVRRRFRLSASSGPIFSIVSRLVHQKGIDLSIAAADTILRNGGQLVVTGRGEPQIERAIEELAFRHKGQVAAHIGFDDQEARAMFSGSDFLLMPSRFEPCGLSQMYAQRSASLPIAYRTGGLADTIEDGRTGFLFSALCRHAFGTAVDRAITSFRSRRTIQRMRRQAVSKRFDWAASASRYVDLYATARVVS